MGLKVTGIASLGLVALLALTCVQRSGDDRPALSADDTQVCVENRSTFPLSVDIYDTQSGEFYGDVSGVMPFRTACAPVPIAGDRTVNAVIDVGARSDYLPPGLRGLYIREEGGRLELVVGQKGPAGARPFAHSYRDN